MQKLTFSGHESFSCRPLWLKKGYDFLTRGGNFLSPEAVVELGVGKNMVSSINYWLQVFGMMNENKEISQLATYLLGENGKDPYLENPATLWLLHYFLVKNNKASIFNLFFNRFRKERPEFSRRSLGEYLKYFCDQNRTSVNPKTLERDIGVFLKFYLKPLATSKKNEEQYSGLFIEQKIIEQISVEDGTTWYRCIINERNEISSNLILFFILDQMEDRLTISTEILFSESNSIGSVIPINEIGLLNHLSFIQEEYSQIVFTEDAGLKELQLKEKLNKWDILSKCYE